MSSARLRVLSSAFPAAAGKAAQPVRPLPWPLMELKRARGKPRLSTFEELPEWYQDNQHIRAGYRPVSGSVVTSFFSWGYIHNETINIYSHLIPAFAFFLGEWYVLQYLHSHYSRVTIIDDLIFVFFLLTATICLGFSTIYHTLVNHSHDLGTKWLRLDFFGIALLTIGDFVSGIYMVFWCEPILRRIYWAMILSLGSITMIVMTNPKLQGRHWRNFRTCCFIGTGMSGLAPLAHGIYLFGFSQMLRQSGMPYYFIEGGFLCLGVLVFATRFPESLSPGTFDIYGSSHQIFHILVVMATVTQLVGIIDAFDYNYHHRTCKML